jgi:formylglycine-generating enzyme required for sulfatase activity
MEQTVYRPSGEYVKTLANNLAKAFSSDELALLCFDLGIEEDGIVAKADPIDLKAIKLIEFCKNRSLLSDLVAVCVKERPGLDWTDLTASSVVLRSPNVAFVNSASKESKLGIEFVQIPSGVFIQGSNSQQDSLALDDEQPQHIIYLDNFLISKFPITNAQYAVFVRETGGKFDVPVTKLQHPVVNVSWHDAMAFCHWLTDQFDEGDNKLIRLPTESEWEKAARGVDGRIYPWGDMWNPLNLNSIEGENVSTTPVGTFSPNGDSPYGVADMVGNVWEWCIDQYSKIGYQLQVLEKKHEEPDTDEVILQDRVIRGGSFGSSQRYSRCACREYRSPLRGSRNVGFRVVITTN